MYIESFLSTTESIYQSLKLALFDVSEVLVKFSVEGKEGKFCNRSHCIASQAEF